MITLASLAAHVKVGETCMRLASLAAFAIAAVLSIGAPMNRAGAVTLAVPGAFARAMDNVAVAQRTGFVCDWRSARAWPPREYWRWGRHPPGEPDAQLLRRWASPIGHFWGTPLPPLVPADVWARKWHPPLVWSWGRHHPYGQGW